MRRTAIANPFRRFGQQRLNVVIEQVIVSDGLLFVPARRVTHRFAMCDLNGGREVGAFEVG